jgi:hypothetical protein
MLRSRLTIAMIGLTFGVLLGVSLRGWSGLDSVVPKSASSYSINKSPSRLSSLDRIDASSTNIGTASEHSFENSYRKEITSRIIALGEIRPLAICNFTDLKLENRLSQALGLTSEQVKSINIAMEDAFRELITLEQGAARLANKANGDQVIEINKFNGSDVKHRLFESVRRTIPASSADILVGLMESSPQFGRFGQQRQEVWIDGDELNSVAGVKPVNLGNFHYDESGKPIGFTGTYLVSAELYKQRYGSLVDQLLPK